MAHGAPDTHPLLRELAGMLGREESLTSVHAAVLRAARGIRPVVESGAMLAACSDEFNGELRSAFDRDVARQLSAPNVPGTRRVFSVSNMGGRIEPGGITLADLHFTARSAVEGEKLLLIEITGHVGQRETEGGTRWGELDRFGTSSPCCGALRLLLDDPIGAHAVRFPWFDQLTAFFGAERLTALREDRSPWSLLRAAVVHAVLQAESAMVDLLREPPATPTHVLMVALVVVNRRGPDHAIPVGVHYLRFARGAAHIEPGASLRSTPGAIAVDQRRTALLLSTPFEDAAQPAAGPMVNAHHAVAPTPLLHARSESDAVRRHVDNAGRLLRSLSKDPSTLRLYSRPLLRAFLQGMSILAPEAALHALAEGGHEAFHAAELQRLLARKPSQAEAQRALHDLEPALQQLGHQQAGEVLGLLLAEHPALSAGDLR